MINQINNISFQGKFTTKMQGRNGILKDVSLAFEQKTKGLTGTLELTRGNQALLLKYNDKDVPFKISNYSDLTGATIKEKTPEAINNIAESLAKVFRILKAQNYFENVQKKLNRSRSKTESALNANKKSYTQALANGNQNCDRMYKSILSKNNTKLLEIEKNSQKASLRYTNFINNIAGDDARAIEYIKTITTV